LPGYSNKYPVAARSTRFLRTPPAFGTPSLREVDSIQSKGQSNQSSVWVSRTSRSSLGPCYSYFAFPFGPVSPLFFQEGGRGELAESVPPKGWGTGRGSMLWRTHAPVIRSNSC
jgi:hypothetical protein